MKLFSTRLLMLVLLLLPQWSWGYALCPQTKIVHHWQSGALTDMWFIYPYTSSTYDTLSPAFNNPPSDKKNVASLEMLDVINSSEDDWYFDLPWDFGNAPKWGNWWLHVHPLKKDPGCNGLAGAALINCENAAYYGMKISECSLNSTPPCVYLPSYYEMHASGPFLSDSNQCEWHQQGMPMDMNANLPIAGKYLAGQQVEFYTNFIIWDWDGWNHKGIKADGVWLSFKEGDEGFEDDYPLSGGIDKGETKFIQSGNATALIHTYADQYYEDGDTIPTAVEIKKFGTDPNKTDSDGDGLTDADEVGFAPCVGSWQSIQYGTDPNKADTDGDGLSDFEEIDKCAKSFCANPTLKAICNDTLVTNPAKPDTDNDGWSDGDEVLIGSNPTDPNSPGFVASGDADGDGLSNGDELKKYKTNPKSKDTDGDGLEDGQEVKVIGSNPAAADSDNDGLSDGEEVKITKTSPTVADTDNDGLSDGDEVKKYGSDPLEDDTDGDGLLDGEEASSGMNPTLNEAAVLMPILALLLEDDAKKLPPPTITGVPTVPVLSVPKGNILTVNQNTIVSSEAGLSSVTMACGGGVPISGTPAFVPTFTKTTYSFNIQVGPVPIAVLCQISATDVGGQTTSASFQVMPQ